MTEMSPESDTGVRRCETCAVYMTRRALVLAPAIVAEAIARNIHPPVMALAYLARVHARHLAGLSLEVSSAHR